MSEHPMPCYYVPITAGVLLGLPVTVVAMLICKAAYPSSPSENKQKNGNLKNKKSSRYPDRKKNKNHRPYSKQSNIERRCKDNSDRQTELVDDNMCPEKNKDILCGSKQTNNTKNRKSLVDADASGAAAMLRITEPGEKAESRSPISLWRKALANITYPRPACVTITYPSESVMIDDNNKIMSKQAENDVTSTGARKDVDETDMDELLLRAILWIVRSRFVHDDEPECAIHELREAWAQK